MQRYVRRAVTDNLMDGRTGMQIEASEKYSQSLKQMFTFTGAAFIDTELSVGHHIFVINHQNMDMQ